MVVLTREFGLFPFIVVPSLGVDGCVGEMGLVGWADSFQVANSVSSFRSGWLGLMAIISLLIGEFFSLGVGLSGRFWIAGVGDLIVGWAGFAMLSVGFERPFTAMRMMRLGDFNLGASVDCKVVLIWAES